VLDFFLSFLKVYDKRKTHNMIFLMLNLRYKNLCIVSSFVGKEQGVVLVEEYDNKSLYPMLVKCHEHLHPLVRSNFFFVDQDIFYHDYNLDIFELITSINEPVKEHVKKELLILKRYQLDVKDIKCLLHCWQKHEAMFLIVGFLVRHILKIVES